MSDVYQSEKDPDDQPGKRFPEGEVATNVNDQNPDDKMARSGEDRRKNGPRIGDRRDRAVKL